MPVHGFGFYVPAIKSWVVYESQCRCESRYVGHTSERLFHELKQLVPSNTFVVIWGFRN